MQFFSNIPSLVKEIVEETGYVILPDLITPEEAKIARARVLQLANQERQTGELVIQGAKERLYGLIYKGKIFRQLVQHPQILTLIQAILGEDIILGGFSAHILHPQGERMGIHVDYPYWAMTPPYAPYPILEIQVIWLVEDFTEENGAPLFVPSSHKLATKPNLQQFEQTAQKITGKAGSAIISHGLCWHDTSVNLTDNPRVSILGNYTPQYIHPLENHSFAYQAEVLEQATPQLKHLLRHSWRSSQKQIFDMDFKMSE